MQTLSPELALVDETLGSAARASLLSYERTLPDVFERLEQIRTEEHASRGQEAVLPALAPAPLLPRVPATPPPTPPIAAPGRARTGSFLKVAVAAALSTGVAWAVLSYAERGIPSPTETIFTPHPRPPAKVPSVGTAVSRAAPRSRTRSQSHPRRAAKPPSGKQKQQQGQSTPRQPRSSRRARSTPATAARSARVLTWSPSPAAAYYRVQFFRLSRQGGRPAFLFEVWTSRPRLAVPRTWVEGQRRHRFEQGSYRWSVYPIFGPPGRIGQTPVAAKAIAHGGFSVPGR